MDRSEILQMMAALQLSGMRAAYDEIVATGIKRKHSVDQIIAALLKAEIAEKHARSLTAKRGQGCAGSSQARLPRIHRLWWVSVNFSGI